MLDALEFTKFVSKMVELRVEAGACPEDAMIEASAMTEAWVAVYVDGCYPRNRFVGGNDNA